MLLFMILCASCTVRKCRLLTSNAHGKGGRGGGSNGSPQDIEALKQSKRNFQSTCSPNMNKSFNTNRMTLALIIYAKLLMQIKV